MKRIFLILLLFTLYVGYSQDEQITEDFDIESLVDQIEPEQEQVQIKDPFYNFFVDRFYANTPYLFKIAFKDVEEIKAILSELGVRKLLPSRLKHVKFGFSKPDDNGHVSVYALKGNRIHKPPLSGEVIVDAYQSYDPFGMKPLVSMQMNRMGSRIWEKLTGNAYRNQTNIAIVLDDVIYSAPGVTSGPISGGRSEISGNFTLEEAIDLANILKSGKLPAKAEIIQSEVVGPSLGQQAIKVGINSFIIALILILIWMVVYYGREGIYANIALLLNLLLIFGILAGLGAVLTLPGIAGIILTIGISVDANVIVFERIKEELLKQTKIKRAVEDGFSNALSSILDANITTALTGIILLSFGSGPIKGFATTLLIGILTSLVTALLVTRLFIDNALSKGRVMTFSTPLTRGMMVGKTYSFLNKRVASYIISGILLLVCITSLVTRGLEMGVDFVGGRSYYIKFPKAVELAQISDQLSHEFGSAEVKTYGTPNQIKFTTNYKINEEFDQVELEIQEKLYNVTAYMFNKKPSLAEFKSGTSQGQYGIQQSILVGPTIVDDIKKGALWAVFSSLIVVFMYILIRFKKWQYSMGAVIAVFHDTLIVLGIYSLVHQWMPFNMEIDQAFIGAILTVIGYSLNDTVIIYDRIREYLLKRNPKSNQQNIQSLFDSAMSSTLSRTINTSLTTLLVLVSIFYFGGESIKSFMISLIIGVVVGTYSSIFIAAPIAYDSMIGLKKNKK